jgi:Flp pilus assembly secretin CpaC
MRRLGGLLVVVGLVVACGSGGRSRGRSCFELGAPVALKPGSGIQVAVEVRFLLVEDSFFDDIGVDFDLDLTPTVDPNPTFGGVLEERGDLGVEGSVVGGPAGRPLIHARGARAGVLLPSLHEGGVPGLGTAGTYVQLPGDDNQCLSLHASVEQPFSGTTSDLSPLPIAPAGTPLDILAATLLDESRLSTILQAIAGDAGRDLLVAPTVTLFDGQRSVSYVRQATASTSDLNSLGQATLAGLPQVPMEVMTGATFEFVPRVSADRTEVRLEIRPGSSLIGVRYPLPITVGPITGQVEMPVFQTCNVSTNVTVPDGGTVLIGGLRAPGQPGTPILSQIPYVNRLFQSIPGGAPPALVLMVTPRIIIQQ